MLKKSPSSQCVRHRGHFFLNMCKGVTLADHISLWPLYSKRTKHGFHDSEPQTLIGVQSSSLHKPDICKTAPEMQNTMSANPPGSFPGHKAYVRHATAIKMHCLITNCETCESSHSDARQWRDLTGLMKHVRILGCC